MLKIVNQLLMLSGFYFILSFVLNSWKINFLYYTSLVLFAVLIVLFVVLFIKKSFGFLEKFAANNPRISNYLKAVGLAQLFDICFGMIPSMFVNTQDYVPVYFKYAAMVYVALLFVSLAYATYINIVKYKKDKGVKKVSKKAPAKK